MAAEQQQNLGPRRMINRVEYIRLLEQALFKLGYADAARQLEAQSGIQMQPASATLFQERLLAGEWEGALQLLPSLLQGHGQPAGQEELRDARFLIRQQQYLEAVEAGDTAGALEVLRSQLAPLAGPHHTPRLHHLAGLLLVPRPQDVPVNPDVAARWSAWLGGGAAHRATLLAHMQAALPPWLMLPEGRLEVLLEQALDTQISRCPYHNLTPVGVPGQAGAGAPHPLLPTLSLLSDYQAGVESLPSQCIQVLDAHTDEVWHIAFSHSGTMLASGSKDRTAIVWAVAPPPHPSTLPAASLGLLRGAPGAGAQGPAQLDLVTHLHTLQGHEAAVLFLCWSPDDRWLLSLSDATVRLWDPAAGTLKHSYMHHQEAVSCCAWMPNSSQFVTGSVDRMIYLCDTQGNEVKRWKRTYRVQDLAVSAGGAALVIAASDKQIHILRLSDGHEVSLAEACPITSLDLSPDGRFLLANLQSQAVHLWQLGQLEVAHPVGLGAALPAQPGGKQPDPMDKLPTAPLVEYKHQPGEGSQLGRFVVRSSFGGAAGSFVVHGSETGQVCIFHRDSGQLLLRLDGHSAVVNACAWPPAAPQLLATASDDRTLRVWLSEAALHTAQHASSRAFAAAHLF